jgi:hypothetical protein
MFLSSRTVNFAKHFWESAEENSWVYVPLIVSYCMLYEWVGILEIKAFQPAVTALKILIPILIILISLTQKLDAHPAKTSLAFFALFMVWSLIVTILFRSENYIGISQWLKFFFRFLFYIAICLYLVKQPQCLMPIMKLLVIIAVCTVIQYGLLETLSYMGLIGFDHIETARGGSYYGPFYLLGNGTAEFSHWYSVPKFRLTGFWLEPSTASGFLFMSLFLSLALYTATQKIKWILAGVTCCVGGFYCFANAGLFALGWSMLVGASVAILGKKNIKWSIMLACFSIFLILFSLLGRAIAITYFPTNKPLLAITGIRGILISSLSEGPTTDISVGRLGTVALPPSRQVSKPTTDISVGRLGTVKETMKTLTFSPFGIGLGIPGNDGRHPMVSSSAPFYWLLYTGIIGLFLLLLRELSLIIAIKEYIFQSSFIINIFQAWLVLFFQNMIYGTWMTPLYLLLMSLIYSAVYSIKQPARVNVI